MLRMTLKTNKHIHSHVVPVTDYVSTQNFLISFQREENMPIFQVMFNTAHTIDLGNCFALFHITSHFKNKMLQPGYRIRQKKKAKIQTAAVHSDYLKIDTMQDIIATLINAIGFR